MAVIGAVFARGGSKGIPGKNLQKIKGKTLTSIALENLFLSKLCCEIYICSDDDSILDEAKKNFFKNSKGTKTIVKIIVQN